MNLADGFDSNYRYVLVAARRARQLLSGARPTIETNTRKPCKIAMEEIQAGKVKWTTPESRRSAVDVANELLEKAMSAKAGE
ncbi:MAG: DNA-directed RNA polymerase subunit omega [Terriglobales bacterium]